MLTQEFCFTPNHYRLLLRYSNSALALSISLLLVAILVCYPLSERFSIPQLVCSHLGLIGSATLLKISYVGRCVAQHGLKMEVR